MAHERCGPNAQHLRDLMRLFAAIRVVTRPTRGPKELTWLLSRTLLTFYSVLFAIGAGFPKYYGAIVLLSAAFDVYRSIRTPVSLPTVTNFCVAVKIGGYPMIGMAAILSIFCFIFPPSCETVLNIPIFYDHLYSNVTLQKCIGAPRLSGVAIVSVIYPLVVLTSVAIDCYLFSRNPVIYMQCLGVKDGSPRISDGRRVVILLLMVVCAFSPYRAFDISTKGHLANINALSFLFGLIMMSIPFMSLRFFIYVLTRDREQT